MRRRKSATELPQGELFNTARLGDGRFENPRTRKKAIGQAIREMEKRIRKPQESREEHDHCEAGGTTYMKNSFREA